MIVGPGRFRIAKVASPGPGASSEGVVVQAVLVMALVTTIGVLLVASRVAGSRQSATAASLSNAARQAAEFGFAEIVAEMNRDSKSYLWVTKFSEWTNVRAGDLKSCRVGSTAADAEVGLPITGSTLPIAVSGDLPSSSAASGKLSYQLTDYKAPEILEGSLPASLLDPSSPQYACREKGKFGNLIGGSGEFTIVGTVKRLDGSIVSSYTLKRKVSVERAAPIFNNPINASPLSRTYAVGDSRFPDFPLRPSGTYYSLDCLYKTKGIIRCTNKTALSYPDPITGSATSVIYDFRNEDNEPSSDLSNFPFVRPAITHAEVAANVVKLTFAAPHGIKRGQTIKVISLPNTPFEKLNGNFVVTDPVITTGPFTLTYSLPGTNPDVPLRPVTTGMVDTIEGDSSLRPLPDICAPPNLGKVKCKVSSMNVKGSGGKGALMLVGTLSYPVEIFLRNNLTVEAGSMLSGGDWSKFLIYGVASGVCPVDLRTNSPQVISINGFSTNSRVESNLQNAFLWLPNGQLQYPGGLSSALVFVQALVGSDCTKSDYSNNKFPFYSPFTSLTKRGVIKGLGGAYGFDGVFGGESPIRVFYRGLGGAEQSLS
jgi:hypothetical protein